MKKLLYLFGLIFIGSNINGQIEIQDYKKQITWDVDKLEQLVSPAATSECGFVKVKTNDAIFSGGCLGTLVRTYVYTDDCGNKAEAEQYIKMRDLVAPTLHNVPKNTTATEKGLPIVAKVTATDNFGDDEVKVTFEEVKTEDQVLRTWSATDKCGNTTVKSQIIKLEDI